MNRVEDILKRCARTWGGKPILVSGGAELSCADFDALSDRVAASLTGQAILPGESVAIFLDNSFEAVAALFAVFKMGGVACPIDSLSRPDEVAAALNASRAACFFTEARLATTAAVAMARSPEIRLTVVSGTEGSPAIDGILRFEDAAAAEPLPAPAGAGDDLAVHFRDHGAAAARLSHRDVLAAVEAAGSGAGADGLLPLSTKEGLVHLLAAMKAGMTIKLAKPFALPDAVRAALLGRKPEVGEATVGTSRKIVTGRV